MRRRPLACAFRRPEPGHLMSTRWSMPPGSARRRWPADRRLSGVDQVPRLVLAKGNYFAYAGRPVFKRLVYPTPVDGGLGVHVTVDLAGRMRFGPDVEWIERESYTVDPDARRFLLRAHSQLLAGTARRQPGAGLLRHSSEADRAGRACGRFHDRRSARPRHAGPGQSVRDRVAGADIVAVACGGDGRCARSLGANLSGISCWVRRVAAGEPQPQRCHLERWVLAARRQSFR